MDSMRILNTSLPGTSPPKVSQPVPEQPETLLQNFKDAALSITKLYKTAAREQTRARTEGYQDALDDLLSYLDKEDIGLSDGEGWRIRRWATERLDGRDSVSQNMESDDETEKAERASSPALQRTQSTTNAPTRTSSPSRLEPTILQPIAENPVTMLPPTSTFTFRSSHNYPQDSDMSSDQESDTNRSQIDPSVVNHAPHVPSASITISRPGRSSSRHGHQNNRHNNRTNGTIGRGAGQKRKINFGDFFDIGNLGNGKEGFGGGGKRGKFC